MLPLVMDAVTPCVYGEDAGLVDVVPGVGAAAADADLLFGGQVVDGDWFGGEAGEGGGGCRTRYFPLLPNPHSCLRSLKFSESRNVSITLYMSCPITFQSSRNAAMSFLYSDGFPLC